MLKVRSTVNNYIENIDKWKKLTDIDFFTYFIKAWISFNAWYRNAFSDVNTDREAINKIKTTGIVKSKVVGLLNAESEEGNFFRSNLAQLHKCLSEYEVKSENKRLYFENLVVGVDRNCLQQRNTFNRISYFVKLTVNRGEVTGALVTVKKANGDTTLNYHYTTYDVDHLRNHNEYKKLSTSQQKEVDNLFSEANPFKPICFLKNDSENSIHIGSYHFINEPELIFQGVVEILYGLRNVLFHGEITPNREHNKIYEPAYKLLKIMLDSLE